VGFLIKHIEDRYCNRLSPEILHERRFKQIEFNRSLRRMNPANNELVLIGPEAMADLEKRLAKNCVIDGDQPTPPLQPQLAPHLRPDTRIKSYIDSGIPTNSNQELTYYHRGYAKAADLLTGENNAPSSEGVATEKRNPWDVTHDPTVDQKPIKRTTRDLELCLAPEPSSQDSEANGKIVDPDAPDYNAAVFYNTILEHFKCPYKRCK
jgi:hypothetical protein